MNALLRDEGTVTLETTLAIAVLVPVLFAILQFGGAFQRWIAQDAVAVQGARHAAEVGGDAPDPSRDRHVPSRERDRSGDGERGDRARDGRLA